MGKKITKAQVRLINLEKEIKKKGISVAYEKLQFAGLRLKSGLCWYKGRYYIFIDRLKSIGQKIDLLERALQELEEKPVPVSVDEHIGYR